LDSLPPSPPIPPPRLVVDAAATARVASAGEDSLEGGDGLLGSFGRHALWVSEADAARGARDECTPGAAGPASVSRVNGAGKGVLVVHGPVACQPARPAGWAARDPVLPPLQDPGRLGRELGCLLGPQVVGEVARRVVDPDLAELGLQGSDLEATGLLIRVGDLVLVVGEGLLGHGGHRQSCVGRWGEAR